MSGTQVESSQFDNRVQEASASTLFQLAWGIVSRTGRKGWQEVAVRSAMSAYAARYLDRFGSVKVLGMSEPMPLDRIYTAVRVVPAKFLSMFRDDDEMEESFRNSNRKQEVFHSECDPLDGVEVANQKQLLNILGAPGSGKSTFLRRIGLEALRFGEAHESKYGYRRLPVLLELNQFRDDSLDVDLTARIADELAVCGFPRSREFVEHALSDGALLVLFDGLDEVPNARLDPVITSIRNFVDRYARTKVSWSWKGNRTGGEAGNRFISSCRTAHYRDYFARFTDVVLADFNDDQIEVFAGNWLTDADGFSSTSDDLLSSLFEEKNAATLELARTPLLLAFLCLTFDDRLALPRTRAVLYKQALEVLLHRWNAQKRVHHERKHAELTPELTLDMLAEFADQLFRENSFFFRREEASRSIQRFISGLVEEPRAWDADEILSEVEVRNGLIVQRSLDKYSFSHLTIQEYLTARKLWDDGRDAWMPVIEAHLDEDRWIVVFELLAGMGRADSLLRCMADYAQRWVPDVEAHRVAFVQFLDWINDTAIQADGGAVSVERAAAARVVLFALVLDFAFNLDRTRVRDLVAALWRTEGEDGPELIDVAVHRALSMPNREARAMKLIRLCVAARLVQDSQLPVFRSAASVNFNEAVRKVCGFTGHVELTSEPMAESWNRCLQIWYVIARCRMSAYRLTASVWTGVCDSILKRPGKSTEG